MKQASIEFALPTSALPSSLELPGAGEQTDWHGAFGAAQGLTIALAAEQTAGPLVVVCPDARRAEIIEAELAFFTGQANDETDSLEIHSFGDRECLPYDRYTPRQEVTSARLRLLHRAPHLKRAVIVTTVAGLSYRLPPREFVDGRSFFIKAGETLSIDRLRASLDRSAYSAVGQVVAPGEFAVRGGIVDVFPMGSNQPFRIELFDNEIDTIRYFDPLTQITVERVDTIELLPAREYPFDEEAIKTFRQAFRGVIEGDPQRQFVYREVSDRHSPPGLEYYLPLFFESTCTLFDYLPDSTTWMLLDDIDETLGQFRDEVAERYEHANLDTEHRVLAPETLFITPAEITATLARTPVINMTGRAGKKANAPIVNSAAPEVVINSRAEEPYAPLTELLTDAEERFLIVAESPGRREALDSVLRGAGLKPVSVDYWSEFVASDASLGITHASIERSCRLDAANLTLLTETQFYGERAASRRRRSARSRDPESIIRNLAELEDGAPVVHEIHGVGRYRGLTSLDIGNDDTEFLTIEYLNGDKLYVPVLSLHLVGRYVGGQPETAPMHKLGTDTWEKSKKRARAKAYDVATELLEIEAMRGARKGIAYDLPHDHYSAFAASFAFDETPDQEQAILDVLEDMQSDTPMDRLVCGDVGFGKTEVAIRAAYVAVLSGRQVAILVPTTLLAQQHFDNFKERFADQAIDIDLVSRFRTKKATDEIIGRLAKGKPDILIGTHRLLQKDIEFGKLGLLIIDEEHRFGVRQKERLKRLRSEVDILTLTATPIPRTLNMAMSGMRQISIIATPPLDRLAIKTFVNEWSDGLVREAIQRELRRGGQVYFLHNEVKTIQQMADELGKLVPDANIGIGHGQMTERDLEQVMSDFYHRRHNVLVCTTIIESGIDIPTANTIIINRADRFGLAQLHQLRGRVGRSHVQAFAYLVTPHKKAMSGDAIKRLEAIESLEELGAGFSLASHDLEIRGAGELLGEGQSGSIDEVGFSMYVEFLNRAIAALRDTEGAPPDQATLLEPPVTPEINLHLPALFPDTYIPDVHLRLVMYKRIASAPDDAALRELKIETIDRFGLIPDAGNNLFRLTTLKLKAGEIGIRNIDVGAGGGRIEFAGDPRLDPMVIVQLIQEQPRIYSMDSPTTLRLKADLQEDDARIETVSKLLDHLRSGVA